MTPDQEIQPAGIGGVFSDSPESVLYHNHDGVNAPKLDYNQLRNLPTLPGNELTDDTAVNNKDTEITDGSPTTNFGTGDSLNTRDNAGGALFRSLMHWTLPSGSGTITKVSLWLKQKTALTTSTDITVRELTQTAWTELGATWNKYDGVTDWTTPGGDYGAAIVTKETPPGAGYWKEFVLYDLEEPHLTHNPVTALADWGADVHLFLATDESVATDNGAIWHSKEAASEDDRPYILITYTP